MLPFIVVTGDQDIANKGEAERCRDLAKVLVFETPDYSYLNSKDFFKSGQYEKAIKFYDKSLRLYPLPGMVH